MQCCVPYLHVADDYFDKVTKWSHWPQDPTCIDQREDDLYQSYYSDEGLTSETSVNFTIYHMVFYYQHFYNFFIERNICF